MPSSVSSPGRRWRWRPPVFSLLLVLLSSAASSSLGQPSASRLLYNATLTLPPGKQFTYLPTDFLPTGWDTTSLCVDGVPPSECAVRVRVTQLTPNPSQGCGMGVAVQVACATQLTPASFPNQVCTSTTTMPDGTQGLLFPQDSPTVAFGATMSYLRTTANGQQPAHVWGLAAAATAQHQSSSLTSNPADITLSPSRLQAMYAIATRNNLPLVVDASQRANGQASSSSIAASDPLPSSSSLGITLLLLQPFPGQCPLINFQVEIEAVQNTRCQSVAAVMGPNATTTLTTTPVPCTSPQGTCVTTALTNVTYTSACVCDDGFGPAPAATWNATATDCLAEYATDLSSSPVDARPINIAAGLTPTDASMLWTQTVNMSAKGEITAAMGVQLNQTMAQAPWTNHAEATARVRRRTHAISAHAEVSTSYSSYWYAKLNLSSSMVDLALVFHVTVRDPPPPPPPGPDPQPMMMQLQMSHRYYPTLALNTPTGCMNASDYAPPSGGGGSGGFDASSSSPPSSCMNFTQAYPDTTTPFASPAAFKLILHPPFLRALFDTSVAPTPGGGDAGGNSTMSLYFSLFFQQDTVVDVRTWFQQDINITTPLIAPSLLAHQEEEEDEQDVGGGLSDTRPAEIPASWTRGDDRSIGKLHSVSVPPSLARSPSGSSGSSSSSGVSDVPPAVVPYANQTWAVHLLENELIYFTVNATGPPPHEELASLYIVVNDSQCASGLVTSGFFAPHWWVGASWANASAAGLNQVGLDQMVLPPATSRAPMALAGGCIRPPARYTATPANAVGYFGRLFTVCATFVQLAVYHVPPIHLNTGVLDTFVTADLNATGPTCWREFTLDIGSSVQNDLLITVDQSDAVILLRQYDLPTLEASYNKTQQQAIAAYDNGGGGDDVGTWQQARILYVDLSNGAKWYLAVYLNPPGASSSQDTMPQPPRTFRIQLTWAENSAFRHLALTTIILLVAGSVFVAGLIALALKLRIDACRRARTIAQSGKNRTHTNAGGSNKGGNKERIRLVSSAGIRDADYSRLA